MLGFMQFAAEHSPQKTKKTKGLLLETFYLLSFYRSRRHCKFIRKKTSGPKSRHVEWPILAIVYAM